MALQGEELAREQKKFVSLRDELDSIKKVSFQKEVFFLLRDELGSFKEKVSLQDRDILSLKLRVKHLAKSSRDYFTTRRDFIDTYKSSIGGTKDMIGSRSICEGRAFTYKDEAIMNALLLESQTYTDIDTDNAYRELYGLDFYQVLQFGIHADVSINTMYLKLTNHRRDP